MVMYRAEQLWTVAKWAMLVFFFLFPAFYFVVFGPTGSDLLANVWNLIGYEFLLFGVLIVGQGIFLSYQNLPRKQLVDQESPLEAFTAHVNAPTFRWLKTHTPYRGLSYSVAQPLCVLLTQENLKLYCTPNFIGPHLLLTLPWEDINTIHTTARRWRGNIIEISLKNGKTLHLTVNHGSLIPPPTKVFQRLATTLQTTHHNATTT